MLRHSNTSFVNQQGSAAFDFGELEEAIVLQRVVNNHKIIISDDHDESTATKQALYATARPVAATLDMFPSWPLRFQQLTPRGSSRSGGEGEDSTDSGSAVNTVSSSDHHHLRHLDPPPLPKMDTESGVDGGTAPQLLSHTLKQTTLEKRKVPGSRRNKVLDAKTVRRLAQNREAARKSRLRKKAYVQQLESSRIRLSQLEQDLQRARSQGLFLAGVGVAAGANISSGGGIFEMEYARWVDEEQRHMSELRTALQAHLSDGDLRVIVDGYLTHYDDIFRLKALATKSDVFHLITGIWASPVERCFLWMGGFRPSHLIKMLISQLDPLTEQQVMGIYGLQQSSQQAEEALTQGLQQLQQSLIDTIAAGSLINDVMHHMALALGKLANLEGFVRQADNLRQQMLHQLRRTLTVRQAARGFLVIGEYYGRLRALSSLWASRPTDHQAMIGDENSCQTSTDVQMLKQQPSQNHLSNF